MLAVHLQIRVNLRTVLEAELVVSYDPASCLEVALGSEATLRPEAEVEAIPVVEDPSVEQLSPCRGLKSRTGKQPKIVTVMEGTRNCQQTCSLRVLYLQAIVGENHEAEVAEL